MRKLALVLLTLAALCFAAPAIMAELTGCFTDPETGCATYQTCVNGVFESHGIDA